MLIKKGYPDVKVTPVNTPCLLDENFHQSRDTDNLLAHLNVFSANFKNKMVKVDATTCASWLMRVPNGVRKIF